MPTFENDSLVMHIDESWSSDYCVGLAGWTFSKRGLLDSVVVSIGNTSVPITTWYPRPDVGAAYPQYQISINCGFGVLIPRLAEHQLTFIINPNSASTFTVTGTFIGRAAPKLLGFPRGDNLYMEFVKLVNDQKLRVLEIGSRVVVQGSSSQRQLFPQAASYVGFDYYPDSNTDVVGDAHKLSQYFGDQKFDAIFSMFVFEHLAMPWVVAMEINKLLEVGGITFHHTHQTWPLHERPWDFWRFSEESLKVLFSRPLGFEIIQVGFSEPVQIYPSQPNSSHISLPSQPSFGGVSILAKKVTEVDRQKFQWEVGLEEILSNTGWYPSNSGLETVSNSLHQNTDSKI